MSKRHFNELAARLLAMRPLCSEGRATARMRHQAEGRMEQWRTMVNGIAMFCAGQNPRFDRSRFLATCGMGE